MINKLLLVFLLFLVYFGGAKTIYGQDTLSLKNMPEKLIGENLEQLEGMWEYADAVDTFRIMFVTAVDTTKTDNYPIECLYGLHYLKHKGEVIFDYLYNIDTISPRKATIWVSNAVPKGYKYENSNNTLSLIINLAENFGGFGSLIIKGKKKKMRVEWDINNWNIEENRQKMTPEYVSMLKKSDRLNKPLILRKVSPPLGYTNHLLTNMPASHMEYIVNIPPIVCPLPSPLVANGLEKFEGAWEYADAVDTFRVIFVKAVDFTLKTNVSVDCLYGLHYYKHNNEVIFDYLYNIDTILSHKATVWASNAVPKDKEGFKHPYLSLFMCLPDNYSAEGDLYLGEIGFRSRLVWSITNWVKPDTKSSVFENTASLRKKLILRKIDMPAGYVNHLFTNMPNFRMDYKVRIIGTPVLL